MDVRVVLLILATTITATGSQKIYASRNPLAVGSSVTLFSQDIVTTGTWIFHNNLIVFIVPDNAIIADSWKDRVTFNSTSSSLTITSVKLEDSGEYTLTAINTFTAKLTLSVQVPISNVSLTASNTDLVEFNDTAVLTCSVLNGTSLSYVWMKGSSEVAAGAGVQLSDGGATLTMVGVTRYDEGSYRCNVSNGVSDAISPPVHLNINYGPSNTTMTITPMRSAYITGSNITLSCSAESKPPAGVQWMFNGVKLNHFGPELQLEMVAENKSGNYKCILHNTVTSRFTSKSGMIRILTPIVAVVVNPTGGPPILHEQYMLHCEVTGYVGNIQWSRNGQPITADNTSVIDMTNRTLLLKPVQLSDNGDYRCEASSPVSNMTSHPYTVEVN
ncbi:carcinoembryonic antigen-related cell adhesion molecule 1-like, partial [Notothenia coriiceps]|uniref:Carcinoembryonic antigen-related cell adhesion molecule 1-like n=1 Tax=Notothenia coriiceps TaxID=8208 RepID=A0A6I9Q2D0_9TELE